MLHSTVGIAHHWSFPTAGQLLKPRCVHAGRSGDVNFLAGRAT
jgi:hypothetical protein